MPEIPSNKENIAKSCVKKEDKEIVKSVMKKRRDPLKLKEMEERLL